MSAERARVLVVDDDADIRSNLTDILAEMGYAVQTAADGAAALEMIRRTPFDVALLDVRMPGMDGLELQRRIRSERPGTVAVIVTAYATEQTAEAAVAAGCWRVLPKPLELDHLLPLLEEAAGRPLVIVIDDDRELCAALGDVLRERGYRVCVAHSMREAALHLEERAIDAALIDMKLPDGDGHQVLEAARRTNPAVRTVLITGHREEMAERVNRSLAEGAAAVCYKPLDVDELLRTLGRLTGRR